jgi:phosphatidylethanolamine/phosphatidyl-N-methylethanolamine N-methyltransferase
VDFYDGCYESVLCEGGTGYAVALAHRIIERGVVGDYPRVLEVGAGTGVHRPYVTHPYRVYVETDLRSGPTISTRADAAALPFADDSFDRVVATCLLIHLPDPERALTEWRRVVRPGGHVTVYVPCDPGVLLRASRAMTTAPKARRRGYADYALWMAREHRNHIASLDARLRHVFRHDDISVVRWPLPLSTWNLNLFFVYHVTATHGQS